MNNSKHSKRFKKIFIISIFLMLIYPVIGNLIFNYHVDKDYGNGLHYNMNVAIFCLFLLGIHFCYLLAYGISMLGAENSDFGKKYILLALLFLILGPTTCIYINDNSEFQKLLVK